MSTPTEPERGQHAPGASGDPTAATAEPSGVDRLLRHAATSDAIERGLQDDEFATGVVEGLDADYVLFAAAKDDWAKAMTDSYEQARKAVTMLLTAHGWRVPDQPGKHARIAAAVEAVVAALRDRRFAIVGGMAVLTHVQGHRVTQDIDSAVRGPAQEIRDALLVVAEPDSDGESDVLLPNGVPVDLTSV